MFLLMASLHHDHGADATYVQGAGDDVENWSAGFRPDVFWANREQLLSFGEDELPELIASIVSQRAPTSAESDFVTISQASWLEIGSMYAMSGVSGYECVTICLGPLPDVLPQSMLSRAYCFPCREDKLGSKDLRKVLSNILKVVQTPLQAGERLRICCSSGKDLAIGVALAVLCLNTGEDGQRLAEHQSVSDVSKTSVRKKLSWITASVPSASPSRATLNAVNEVLMDPRSVG